jgi:pterin-4a-carbinolamine dehydratase
MSNSIFVNYRQSDSQHAAMAIASILKHSFAEGEVFIDRSSILGGRDWPNSISNALESAQVLVAVLGEDWLRSWDGHGRRRIDHPKDWVRLELSRAFERGIPVVPVLLENAEIPPPEALDTSLLDICRAQAERIRLDTWDSDLSRLIGTLSQLITGVVRRTPSFPIGLRIVRPHPHQKERPVLSSDELTKSMQYIPNWCEESNSHNWAIGGLAHELVRVFEFTSFNLAIQFMNFAAKEIDNWQPQHHPRWENQWRSVKVWFTTWDAGCRITKLDVTSAEKLDSIHLRFNTGGLTK